MGKKTTPTRAKKTRPAAGSSGRPSGTKTAAGKQGSNKPVKLAAAKTKSVATASKKTVVVPPKTAKPAGPLARPKPGAANSRPVAKARIAEIIGLPKAPAVRSDLRPQRVQMEDEDEPVAAKGTKAGGNGDVTGRHPADGPAKSYLSPKELEEFRDLLLAKRQELIRDVTNLENEAMRHSSAGGSTSSMPIHMADLGSDTWEQELTLGLIENERNLLREIDEALDRVDNQTYGMCLATNRRISKARLRAKPWAKYCIEYARKLELGLA